MPIPEIRFLTGVASFRVGEIQRTLGQIRAAEQAYRRAIAIFEARREGDHSPRADTAVRWCQELRRTRRLLFNTGRAEVGKEAIRESRRGAGAIVRREHCR